MRFGFPEGPEREYRIVFTVELDRYLFLHKRLTGGEKGKRGLSLIFWDKITYVHCTYENTLIVYKS